MGIIRNIQNNIVVIYEIKSFYVTLAAGKFFPNNIHRVNYHCTHRKNWKNYNTTVPLDGIVYRKKPQIWSPDSAQLLLLTTLWYKSFVVQKRKTGIFTFICLWSHGTRSDVAYCNAPQLLPTSFTCPAPIYTFLSWSLVSMRWKTSEWEVVHGIHQQIKFPKKTGTRDTRNGKELRSFITSTYVHRWRVGGWATMSSSRQQRLSRTPRWRIQILSSEDGIHGTHHACSVSAVKFS
jgi:hypothetical protein